MFNINEFKRMTKEWLKKNPNSTVEELIDFCESIIPQKDLISHYWIIDETKNWYKYLLYKSKKQ